jgi:hypothetical protein
MQTVEIQQWAAISGMVSGQSLIWVLLTGVISWACVAPVLNKILPKNNNAANKKEPNRSFANISKAPFRRCGQFG